MLHFAASTAIRFSARAAALNSLLPAKVRNPVMSASGKIWNLGLSTSVSPMRRRTRPPRVVGSYVKAMVHLLSGYCRPR